MLVGEWKGDKGVSATSAWQRVARVSCNSSHGMLIETISRLMGHTAIRTTQIYANVTRTQLDREMSRLSEQVAPLAERWQA